MQNTTQLRPMDIGDILDAAFRLYRTNFVVFLGISALLQVPMAILQFVLQFAVVGESFRTIMAIAQRPPVIRPGQGPLDVLPMRDYALFFTVTIGLALIQYLLVHNLASAALTNAVAQRRAGRPVTILGAYALPVGRYLSVIVASLAPALAVLLVSGLVGGCLGGAIAVFAINGDLGVTGALIGVLVLLGLALLLGLLALLLFTRLSLTTQAAVLEGAGPLASVGRSWRLVGRGFWRALLLVVMMGILTYMVSSLPAVVASTAITAASGDPLASLELSQGVTSIVAYGGLILSLPLQLALYTVLYDDLRVRAEGYDLELRARQTLGEV